MKLVFSIFISFTKRNHIKKLKNTLYLPKKIFYSRNTESFNLDINQKLECVESPLKKIPFWHQLKNMLLILALKTFKAEWMALFQFFFKFVDKDQVLKEILKSWVEIKLAKKMIYQSK